MGVRVQTTTARLPQYGRSTYSPGPYKSPAGSILDQRRDPPKVSLPGQCVGRDIQFINPWRNGGRVLFVLRGRGGRYLHGADTVRKYASIHPAILVLARRVENPESTVQGRERCHDSHPRLSSEVACARSDMVGCWLGCWDAGMLDMPDKDRGAYTAGAPPPRGQQEGLLLVAADYSKTHAESQAGPCAGLYAYF
jgi:hypothetical protein